MEPPPVSLVGRVADEVHTEIGSLSLLHIHCPISASKELDLAPTISQLTPTPVRASKGNLVWDTPMVALAERVWEVSLQEMA